MTETAERLRAALSAPDSSARLQAAMTAGTSPHDDQVDVLLDRCAAESDFFVRDMLSWALLRHPVALTMPRLLGEVKAGGRQARRQALHTLSKIGDPRGWEAITPELLSDSDDQTARTAWRAAVALVPDGAEHELATLLVAQLGRGDRDTRETLSRSLATLGDAADAALATVAATVARDGEPDARQHAIATRLLMHDPELDFDTAMLEAREAPANTTDAP